MEFLKENWKKFIESGDWQFYTYVFTIITFTMYLINKI
jgi:hypothetical protein